ncbi:MAG TPA: beta-ketoacyl synthase chain length factor [Burkholderiaceae bacterium]|nr:beta-ketoacyl synthase chain length factor [Burkholderiaceae bacterium]
MITCAVLGIGVYGPGLVDWPAARAVLSGSTPYARTDNAAPPSGLLPAAERRRATPSTRTALTAAQQALLHANVDAKHVPAVFGSDSGSPEIIHETCAMLAAGDYQISPTKFHNSVHNAASGYYSIAVESHRAVTSLCAFDGTAAATLLEAAVQVAADQTAVLMVCYDLPYPFPLSEARSTVDAWAVALVLAPANHASAIAHLTLSDAADDVVDTALDDPALSAARLGNPTARLLPLLAALARPGSSEVALRQSNGRALRVNVATDGP